MAPFKLTSFENASILRKVTILYVLVSIVPVGVLYYLYLQLKDHGKITITEDSFSLTLSFVVTGVGVGYFVIRSLIVKIIELTKKNQQTVDEILGSPKSLATHETEDENNEIAVLARSFNEITAHLEENVRNLQLAKKTLHSVLSRVGQGIASMQNIDSFLSLIIETVTNALQCDGGALLLKDGAKNEFYFKEIYGETPKKKLSGPIRLNSPLFQTVLETGRPQVVKGIPQGEGYDALSQESLLCAPLVLHHEVLGMICVWGDGQQREFEEEEKNLLYNLALQTAVAIENSRLNEDAEHTYFETISALALAVEAKDPYSRGHSERVANYVVQIAQAMNLNPDDVNNLRDAAKLHDIGKIGITDKILKKNGPLSDEEKDIMAKHVEIGEGIIKPIRSLRSLCDIVRHHHEKLDGTGYPDQLKGDEIQLLVRILAVADIFDALTSERPYRKAFTLEEAIGHLRDMKYSIDQRVVDALVKVIKS